MKRPTPPAASPSADEAPPPAPRPHIERISFSAGGVVSHPELFEQCRALRQRVFVEEQSVPAELEWDGLDESAEHFAAFLVAPSAQAPTPIIGTARLRWLPPAPSRRGEVRSSDGPLAKAERVAVLASARKSGIGRSLMEAVERRAVERGHTSLPLNAQVSVVSFYERLGYSSHGETFLSAGIEHRAMTKRIA